MTLGSSQSKVLTTRPHGGLAAVAPVCTATVACYTVPVDTLQVGSHQHQVKDRNENKGPSLNQTATKLM